MSLAADSDEDIAVVNVVDPPTRRPRPRQCLTFQRRRRRSSSSSSSSSSDSPPPRRRKRRCSSSSSSPNAYLDEVLECQRIIKDKRDLKNRWMSERRRRRRRRSSSSSSVELVEVSRGKRSSNQVRWLKVKILFIACLIINHLVITIEVHKFFVFQGETGVGRRRVSSGSRTGDERPSGMISCRPMESLR